VGGDQDRHLLLAGQTGDQCDDLRGTLPMSRLGQGLVEQEQGGAVLTSAWAISTAAASPPDSRPTRLSGKPLGAHRREHLIDPLSRP